MSSPVLVRGRFEDECRQLRVTPGAAPPTALLSPHCQRPSPPSRGNPVGLALA